MDTGMEVSLLKIIGERMRALRESVRFSQAERVIV